MHNESTLFIHVKLQILYTKGAWKAAEYHGHKCVLGQRVDKCVGGSPCKGWKRCTSYGEIHFRPPDLDDAMLIKEARRFREETSWRDPAGCWRPNVIVIF